MAFTLDQANLGTVVNVSTNLSTWTLTTSATAAAGSLIVIAAGWFNGNTVASVSLSGGGLSWQVPISNGLTTSTDACALAYVLAPSGLASGTVLTWANSGGATTTFNSPSAVAMSFLGAAASSPLDGTSSKAYASITAGAWSGNTISGMTGSSDLVFVCAFGDGNTGTVTTDTAGTGWTGGPIASQAAAQGGVVTSLYAMNVASTPNPSPWGTWGTGSPTGTAVITAAFRVATVLPRIFNPIPLM